MDNVNKLLIKSAFTVTEEIGASSVFIYVDPLNDLKYEGRFPKKADLFLISKKKKWDFEKKDTLGLHSKGLITLPRIHFSRMSLIKTAMMFAMSLEHVKQGDIVVFAAGITERGLLDLIQVVDTSKETELLTGRLITSIAEHIKPEVFQAILNLTAELADKGREGRPVGTIFVVGDEEKVMQFSKQMIINPFKGYDEESRNLLNPELKETIREFSGLDGAFVISGDGNVITAGRYLNASTGEEELERGLGSRHLAAAGITALTNAVAFVISESSGDLRIFKGGKVLMVVEKTPGKGR